MPCISCFLKNPLPWMSVLGLVLASLLLGYGFSFIILTSVVTFSTLIFNMSKKKPMRLQVEKSVKDDHHQETRPYTQDIISRPALGGTDNESEAQKKEDEGGNEEDDEYLTRSSAVILSESECQGRSSTSEDSEVDYWRSDGYISDEDSLIEIALPSGHYIGHCKEEEPKFNLHKKLPDFSPHSFFKQHALVELLAELNDMNEEENLIEIDISVGSIKCPRFEIEA